MNLHGLVTRLGVCVETTIYKAVILSADSHGFIARSEVEGPRGCSYLPQPLKPFDRKRLWSWLKAPSGLGAVNFVGVLRLRVPQVRGTLRSG
jgi:hypothetical protein